MNMTIALKRLALAGLGLAVFGGWAAAAPAANADLVQSASGFTIQTPPRVFLDCPGCDIAGLQKEIAFVEWVAAAGDAQVVIAITSEAAASGETVYKIQFRGQREFNGDDSSLDYTAGPEPKPDDLKAGLGRTLKLGLMRYVGKTPVAKRIEIALKDTVKPTAVIDPWNFWVFSLSLNGFFNGEASTKYKSIYGSVSANRTTLDWKIRLSANASSYKNVFKYEGEEIVSTSESRSFQGMIVRSLDDHWSVGGYLSVYSSTYSNYDVNARIAPAVEFDLFPYSQSTRHQLRFLYTIGFNLVRYREETIFNKTRESLLAQSVDVTLELNRKWGTASASLEGSHYLHDFKKNRVALNGEISVRLFKGLSFNIDGGGSRIRDQLNLAKGGATLEEVLLRRKQLATSYYYYFSVGLRFSFGSVRSNVVNPRFGTGGSSISISF